MSSGDVIPSLGQTKSEGTENLAGNSLHIDTQVAGSTKPLACVDAMVSSSIMVIMHRIGGFTKRLDTHAERRFRDTIQEERGQAVALARAGGAFRFEMHVKAEE